MSIRLFITGLNLIAKHIIFSLIFRLADGLRRGRKGWGKQEFGVRARRRKGGVFHLDGKSIILVFSS